jgi:peptide methionine sulfoxide reductase MsrB
MYDLKHTKKKLIFSKKKEFFGNAGWPAFPNAHLNRQKNTTKNKKLYSGDPAFK